MRGKAAHLAGYIAKRGSSVGRICEVVTFGLLNIHPLQKQHVEMLIQIERAAESLDQRDCARVCTIASEAGFPDQVRGDNR